MPILKLNATRQSLLFALTGVLVYVYGWPAETDETVPVESGMRYHHSTKSVVVSLGR
jgi:hypothetical protein